MHEIFVRRLEEERKKITQELAAYKKELDFGSDTDHLEEETDEAEEFATYVGVAHALSQRLTSINQALQRMREGTYGTCARCKAPIEHEILEVEPESLLCKTCKHG